MDAQIFDTLARSRAVTGSRRRALWLTLSGVFVSRLRGEAWQAAHAAKKCKKIKNKQKRKKCLAKACTPNCDRKICGDDGCGGSCGRCLAPEQCQAGRCICVPNCSNRVCGSDSCTGSCGTCLVAGQSCSDAGQCVCESACGETEARIPGTCDCCTARQQFCNPAANTCCSGSCPDGGPLSFCAGLGSNAECDFDAQCASGRCAPVFCPETGCDHVGRCE